MGAVKRFGVAAHGGCNVAFYPSPPPLSLKGRGEIPQENAFGSPSPVQGEGAGG